MRVGDINKVWNVRCPNGCDLRWLQRLPWDFDPADPIEEKEVTHDGRTIYTIGLRCADCGHRYGMTNVSTEIYDALNRFMAEMKDALLKHTPKTEGDIGSL